MIFILKSITSALSTMPQGECWHTRPKKAKMPKSYDRYNMDDKDFASGRKRPKMSRKQKQRQERKRLMDTQTRGKNRKQKQRQRQERKRLMDTQMTNEACADGCWFMKVTGVAFVLFFLITHFL